jgi:hypothetical protein
VKECLDCGEWSETVDDRFSLCDSCATVHVKIHLNQRRLWDRFFSETRRMIYNLDGRDLFDGIPGPFAERRKPCGS